MANCLTDWQVEHAQGAPYLRAGDWAVKQSLFFHLCEWRVGWRLVIQGACRVCGEEPPVWAPRGYLSNDVDEAIVSLRELELLKGDRR